MGIFDDHVALLERKIEKATSQLARRDIDGQWVVADANGWPLGLSHGTYSFRAADKPPVSFDSETHAAVVAVAWNKGLKPSDRLTVRAMPYREALNLEITDARDTLASLTRLIAGEGA